MLGGIAVGGMPVFLSSTFLVKASLQGLNSILSY